ncbi:DNA sulfur modification protein DndB [uncultured Bacteroides sp.]|uniref:DNA sulfur modification protein DndB n=1 Tax=uncultured Bacteroides sp. TaxID=162156 RepID=UPI00260DD815|nr:DNA sulfur modification protein DndB [uncultured Bacteroides sp.]
MNAFNIPAIRGVLGNIVYYTSSFTFTQIANLVRPIDDELHTSTSLKDQLQRSLTENHKSITSYILTQKEHFFNSLVLAVYDGEPIWNEIEVGFKGEDYYNMGFLRLTGDEKIFPVDGQHRVEGIKSAIKERPELGDESIAVILIGHQTNKEGMEKTRRIFSTLNRYAKPVSTGDIIALDEDDTVAIVTKNLLETYPLFINDKIGPAKKSKALSNDTKSFTSLLTLYETNKIIYRYYISITKNKKKLLSNPDLDKNLKFRPSQNEIDEFEKYLVDFWNLFTDVFKGVKKYVGATDNAALPYRNRETGGLMYFRPIALPRLITAILETCFRKDIQLSECMSIYSEMEMCISKEPWINILWDPIKQTMIMTHSSIIDKLLMFLYDSTMLTDREITAFKKKYAKALNIDINNIEAQLEKIKMY